MGGRRNGWKEEEWMEGRDLSANSTLRMRGEERTCPAVDAGLSPLQGRPDAPFSGAREPGHWRRPVRGKPATPLSKD